MEVTFTEVLCSTFLPPLVCFNQTIKIYTIAIPLATILFGVFLVILSMTKINNGIVIGNHYSFDEDTDLARYYCKVKYGNKICENVAVTSPLVSGGDDTTYWEKRIDDATRNDFMQSFVDSICKINSTLHVHEPLFVGKCGYNMSIVYNVGVVFLIVGGTIMSAFLVWVMFIMYNECMISRRQTHNVYQPHVQVTERIRETYDEVQSIIEHDLEGGQQLFEQQIRQLEQIIRHDAELDREIDEISGGIQQLVELRPQIHRLQTLQQPTEQISTFDETKQTTCSICLIDFDNITEQTILRCKHKFHTKCIFNCFTIKNECPICKRRHVYDSGDGNGAENV